MKRVVTVAVVADLFIVIVLLQSEIKEFLWTHPWWHSALVLVPTIAVPILAYFELRHSGEANTLRDEANRLRETRNDLQRDNTQLREQLDTERNQHLQQIALNVKPPLTQADRHAATLGKYIGATLKATDEEDRSWGYTPQLVEVSEDKIITLFAARGVHSNIAWAFRVRCSDLEITEIPEGSCPIRIKVLKRYGAAIPLGEIATWEERKNPQAISVVSKGGMVRHATYGKGGSPETRSILVYVAADGGNLFVLEAQPGGTFTGDNVEVSRRFMGLQIEYEAAGFTHRGGGTGGNQYPLFIKT